MTDSRDQTRYELHRTNGRHVEVVRDLNGRPLSLQVARLLQEKDRNAGTRSTIVPQSRVRASGRMVR
jgi:hypothetical protein